MAGKPSLTIPPSPSNSSRVCVVSMGSLRRRGGSGEQVSLSCDLLHGFGEGAAQGAGVASGPDGPEGFDLDLPGPFLGDAELFGDLAQGAGLAAVQPVAHLDDPGLPLGQRPHGLDERELPLAGLHPGVVVAGTLVGKQLAHLGAFFALDPGVDAAYGLPDLTQPPGLLGLDPEPLYYLFLGGLTAKLQAQRVLGAAQAVDGVNDVRRQPYGPGVVGHGPRDGLADPPSRVRREAVAHLGVELLDGPDQAGVPLLDEVLEGHAPPPVLLGDGDHQPQIALDEPLTRPQVPPMGTPGKILLLVGVEQPAAPHPAQVLCENVLRFHHCVSPLVGFRLRASGCRSLADAFLLMPPGRILRPSGLRALRSAPGCGCPGWT